MSCVNSLKGLLLNECEANLAGVKELYLTDDKNLQVTGNTSGDSAMTITNITGATFYKYELDEQVGYLTSTSSVGDNGKLRYYTNEIRVAFPHMDERRHLEFLALTHNPIKALVLDNNDVWHFVSYDQWLRAKDGATAMTGQNYDDENGYEVILSGRSAYPSFIVPANVAEAVIETPVEGA